ncbi:MAG: hypothetical protein DWH79_11700 [Planctomycetota bacterium]|nr:MAG: hypothetical protein DWH79_11700 [Planctomycetota bacterium]
MPTFDFFPLLWWGLPLVAAPIIIHLINLLRHRRVPWAAMEFLLASQKKYRTRVLLKQLLLLALRVLAIAGIVLAMAQPRWTHALGHLLGGTRTAHVVLLDDSYSMGDRTPTAAAAGGSAFERGVGVVERICGELLATRGRQEIAVGRLTRLSQTSSGLGVADPPADAEERFDIPLQAATPEVVQRIRDALARFAPSSSDAGPRGALAAAAELFGSGGGTKTAHVVWLVSDFRVAQWQSADDTVALVRRLAADGAEIRLIDCAADGPAAAEISGGGEDATASARGNLTIERVEMVGGVPASGVLVPMEVAVRNNAPWPVRGVAVDLREDGVPRPGVRLELVPPGATAVQRFDVRFPKAGGHTVEARLPVDVLATDNVRTAVIEIVDRVDVLLIDGALADGVAPAASRGGDAFYLSTALAPGAGAPTGLQPRVEPPRSLATLDLNTFDCVWLLDVERLDGPEVAALEAYTKGGGGVVFFVGPRTKPETVNRTLYRDGAGLFPAPLAGAVDLLADTAEQRPDVAVEEHPVVAVLSGQRNPLLDAVRIDRFMAVQRGWEPAAGSGLRRLLSLRNGAPLMLEQSFGAGLVVAVCTTASPSWNNWSRGNPSWVVVMLELESHLARGRRRAESLPVGAGITVGLDPAVDGLEVDFLLPPDGTVVHQVARERGVERDTGASRNGSSARMAATLPITDVAGAYAVRWRRSDGQERERVFAVNVDPEEGRLERVGREGLDASLAGIPFRYENATLMDPGSSALAGVSLVTPLLLILLGLLLLEQVVAYSASYHPARRPSSA